jgi:hypothetical protein
MNFIKSYKLFESITDENTLWIFDFDDTLVDSPRIEEQIFDFLNEDLTIKDLLEYLLNQINAKISDLKFDNGRYYIEDTTYKIDIAETDWIRKKERVYLTAPERYYYSNLSFPDKITDLADIYKNVKNKAIVTARYDKIRYKVEEYLEKLGFEMPNYGLYCYPGHSQYKKRASVWKGDTIVNLIESGNFNKAIFYDDTSKTVREVRKIIADKLPQIDFEAIKVKGWWT